MKFLDELLIKYHRYMWTYYNDQEIAKKAFIETEEARHYERMSELYKLDPYDSNIVKAEIHRWGAFWEVQFHDQCKISKKAMKHHDRQMHYMFKKRDRK